MQLNNPVVTEDPPVDNARAKKSATERCSHLLFPPQDAASLDEVYAHLDGVLVMPCSTLGITTVIRSALQSGTLLEDRSGYHELGELIETLISERIAMLSAQPVTPLHDPVNRPKHYALGTLPPNPEWFDVRGAIIRRIPQDVAHEAVVYWSEAITYMARMWQKNGLEDARKAHVYIGKLINVMEGASNESK